VLVEVPPSFAVSWPEAVSGRCRGGRLGDEFPLEFPGCGGDIRLIGFITEPDLIRRIPTPRRTARAFAPPARPWFADRLARGRAGR
jgi:hypothetical protein